MNDEVWGEIVDNICINIVVASAAWIAEQPGYWLLSTPDNVAWIGATVTDGKYEPFPTVDPV
jgi:hypothetical protein